VLVCATSEVAKNTITHNFHADFIALSSFLLTKFLQKSFPDLHDPPNVLTLLGFLVHLLD